MQLTPATLTKQFHSGLCDGCEKTSISLLKVGICVRIVGAIWSKHKNTCFSRNDFVYLLHHAAWPARPAQSHPVWRRPVPALRPLPLQPKQPKQPEMKEPLAMAACMAPCHGPHPNHTPACPSAGMAKSAAGAAGPLCRRRHGPPGSSARGAGISMAYPCVIIR